MIAENITLKKASKVGLLALVALVVGAIVFFKERVFFADAAYVAFNIINYSHLDIQCDRYGSFVSQIVLLIGQKMHLPLRMILMSYSASFFLFYLSAGVVLVYWFRQYAIAVLMALYYFLVFSDSYFWISEIPQGIGWMFLALGTVLCFGGRKVNFFLIAAPFLIFSVLAVTTHFVILMPFLFLWVYLLLEQRNWPFGTKGTILFSALLAAAVGAKFIMGFFFQSSTGEASLLHNVTHVSFKDIFNSFSTPVVRMFFYRCAVNYWALSILFITGIVHLFFTRKYLLAVWTLFCCLGYVIIMGLTYGELDEHVLLFHIESEWTCIGIIAATPFVFSVLPVLRQPVAVTVLAVVFIARIAYIASAIPMFAERTHFQEEVLGQMKKKGLSKVAFLREWGIRRKIFLDWASSDESLLMSAMNGDKPNCSYVFIDSLENERQKQAVTTGKTFFHVADMLPMSWIKKEYFDIDTTTGYKVMLYEDLMK